MCQKAESYMALTIQEPAAGQSYKEDQFKDASYMQGQVDFSFMNHQVEEHCNVNQDSIAHNTRIKRRAMEVSTPPPLNQASTSNAIPHEQSENDQSNAFQQQRQNNGKKGVSDPPVVPSQPPTSVAPKASTKVPTRPFSVVEQMKKTNVNISMWDVVATIPMQKRLLQQELESIEPKDQPPNMESATSLVQPSKEVETSKKVRPPPFYVSLIIGDRLVHNCMIDSGASSLVMPRCVVDALEMKYEPTIRDVL